MPQFEFEMEDLIMIQSESGLPFPKIVTLDLQTKDRGGGRVGQDQLFGTRPRN